MIGTWKLLLICHQLYSAVSDADRSRDIEPDNFLAQTVHYINPFPSSSGRIWHVWCLLKAFSKYMTVKIQDLYYDGTQVK